MTEPIVVADVSGGGGRRCCCHQADLLTASKRILMFDSIQIKCTILTW